MTEQERGMLSALAVTITGLGILAVVQHRDSSDAYVTQALRDTIEAGKMFTERLQVLLGPDADSGRNGLNELPTTTTRRTHRTLDLSGAPVGVLPRLR